MDRVDPAPVHSVLHAGQPRPGDAGATGTLEATPDTPTDG